MILYKEKKKETKNRKLNLKTISSKLQNNKSTQKNCFHCTNNDKPKRKIKKTISFIIALKRIKYLGMDSLSGHTQVVDPIPSRGREGSNQSMILITDVDHSPSLKSTKNMYLKNKDVFIF